MGWWSCEGIGGWGILLGTGGEFGGVGVFIMSLQGSLWNAVYDFNDIYPITKGICAAFTWSSASSSPAP